MSYNRINSETDLDMSLTPEQRKEVGLSKDVEYYACV